MANSNLAGPAPTPAESSTAEVLLIAVAVPATVVATPVETVEPAAVKGGNNDRDMIGFGMLGLGLIAGIGALALRRRRPANDNRTRTATATFDPISPIALQPDSEVTKPMAYIAEPGPRMAFSFTTVPVIPDAGPKGFIMPEGPVPTGEAREELLREMVAASPDEANPFTSHKSRRHRARIILQAREHQLRNDATEPFNFRTYARSSELTEEEVKAPIHA